MSFTETPTEVEDEQACIYAMLLSTFQVVPAILNAAIELKLFDIMAQSAPPGVNYMSASEIASHLPTQHPDLPDRLDRMLFVLASFSVLNWSTRTREDGKIEKLYGLSPTSKYFVQNETDTLASWVKYLFHPSILQLCVAMKDTILDGETDPFEKVHGVSAYKFLERNPKLNDSFNKAMTGISAIKMRKYLEVYKGFEGVSTLVDVGGGTGQSLKMIISKYPSIKGINFDLPQVIDHAPTYPGIKHVGGDMYKSIPKGDAIMLKATCHNWSDEKCVELLRNCHKALPENGKVIIFDMILPEEPEPTLASKFVSIADNMMFQYNGRERTEKEFEKLSKDAGFSSFRVACLAYSMVGIMECYK